MEAFAPQYVKTIDHPGIPAQDVLYRLRSTPTDGKTRFHALRGEDIIHMCDTFEETQKGAEGEERLQFCTIYVPPQFGTASRSGYVVQYMNVKAAASAKSAATDAEKEIAEDKTAEKEKSVSAKVTYVDIINLDHIDICVRLNHADIKAFPPMMILKNADIVLNRIVGNERPIEVCSLM